MPLKTHTYTKAGITVLWQPEKCTHSAVCVKGLPGVFNVKKSPWVNMEGAEVARIADQVKRCPSGALSLLPAD